MRFTLLITLILFTNIVFSNDYIIRTQDTGFYQLSHSDIKKLGIQKPKVSKGDFTINSKTGPSPYFFSTGKSKLKSNDNVVFFADALVGKHTKQHPLDDLNGFTLEKSKNKIKTKDWFYKNNAFKKLKTCENILTHDHYEVNKYLIRVNTREYKDTPELWYWKQLSYLLKDGFSIPIDVSNAKSLDDVHITATFRSRNVDRRAKEVPDHQVQILLNGQVFSTLEWNGKIEIKSEKLKLPEHLIKPENNIITFKVPKRLLNKKAIIDASMLDYFRIDYSIKPSKITDSYSLYSNKNCKIELNDKQFAYSKSSNKIAHRSIELNPDSKVYLGDLNQLKTPELSIKSSINADLSEIEYLMIAHPSFSGSTQVLSDFYNNKGIKTSIIDTEQIYHSYSHGVRELHSLKEIIKETYEQGNGKLKYVLMVGDSSWDWRDNGESNKYGNWANRNDISTRIYTNFPHQKNYTSKYINRDFVPTGQYHSPEGHSASDNWFASIIPEKNIKNKEDYIPDLAIGRFPVSTTEELDAMIEKTINYTNNSKVGPWKSRVLWIANADVYYQNTSVNNAKIIEKHGVKANNIFPKEMDGNNIEVQETVSNSFDDGNLIVHFIGHGGKSIWQIGPADLNKNRDMFNLDHISQLNNSNKLPFVMSMSCYSAPFDHPFADSIGEKFIREPKVGAVAVLASSWRNAPDSTFSKYILESLYENPDKSVGQAILAGKRKYRGRIMVEMYNLLGDPALRLAIPELNMSSNQESNKVSVSIEAKAFQGKAIVETIDKNSKVLSSMEIVVPNPDFSFELDKINEGCHLGKIYAWDTERNIDAISSFNCN